MISSFVTGMRIRDTRFVIVSIKQGATSTGSDYVQLVLQDSSGQIDGKIWNMSQGRLEVMLGEKLTPGKVLSVTATVGSYNKKADLKIDGVGLDNDMNVMDLVPRVPGIEALYERLRAIVSSVTDPHIVKLLDHVLDENETKFMYAPAAMKLHHAIAGGLLVHVLSLAELSRRVSMHYALEGSTLDADYLVAGAVLHDIGKIDELTAIPVINYTRRGQLCGHIALGYGIVMAAFTTCGTPDNVRERIYHIILSHHGALEHGSPTLPKTLEAVVFHQLDKLDSMHAAVTRLLKGTPEGEFTAFDHTTKVQYFQVEEDDLPAEDTAIEQPGPYAAVPAIDQEDDVPFF